MTCKQISNGLIIVLALIAAITATGLLAGLTMQPLIVGYWVTLTMKNVVDYVGVKKDA